MNAPVLVTSGASAKKWLAYVVDTFGEVTGIPLRILEEGASLPEGTAVIRYAPQPASTGSAVYVPETDVDDSSPERTLRFVGDVFRGTSIDGDEAPFHAAAEASGEAPGEAITRTPAGLAFRGDLFRNAFLRLSCAEERRLEKEKGPSHGYRRDSALAASYLKPIVNYLFEALKLALIDADPRLADWRPKSHASLLLTHDVDAVRKTFLKATKQSVMNLAQGPRSIRKHGLSSGLARMASAFALPFTPDDFDRLEAWRDWDRAAGADTVYYVYARTPTTSLRGKARAAVFDPDYDLPNDARLAQRLATLRRGGAAIGLHGSFLSHDDPEKLATERLALERAVDAPVDQIRQHWLRFRFDATWRAQAEAGFKVDAGFGFNDTAGFRSWICHPHRPWDEGRQAAHPITVVPMAAMDSTLFDYLDLSETQILETLTLLKRETAKFGGRVAFNWHTHGASRHLRWDGAYRRFLTRP